MKFWTESEYNKFIEEVKDKPLSFYAFETLYWCGLRTGELLALTKEKFDFTNNTIRVNQSLQRISDRNVITEPKTQKSIRTVVMPAFLAEEMKKYMAGIYKLKDNQLLFPITKSYLHHEMTRGSTKAGVKRIRVHDLRHSHVSLLIELGYSAIAIADRLGHESIDITYRYAHLFPSKQNDMAISLSNIRKEKKTQMINGKNCWRMKMTYKMKKLYRRKRNKIISFRATEEEAKLLDRKVEISGLTKQDYIITSLTSPPVSIKADYRLEDKFALEIFRLAKIVKKYGRLEEDEQEILRFLIEIYYEIKKEKSL